MWDPRDCNLKRPLGHLFNVLGIWWPNAVMELTNSSDTEIFTCMFPFTHWGDVIDGQNTAAIVWEDKVEGGWGVTCSVSCGSRSGLMQELIVGSSEWFVEKWIFRWNMVVSASWHEGHSNLQRWGTHRGFVPLFEKRTEQYCHLILLRMSFCEQVTPWLTWGNGKLTAYNLSTMAGSIDHKACRYGDKFFIKVAPSPRRGSAWSKKWTTIKRISGLADWWREPRFS